MTETTIPIIANRNWSFLFLNKKIAMKAIAILITVRMRTKKFGVAFSSTNFFILSFPTIFPEYTEYLNVSSEAAPASNSQRDWMRWIMRGNFSKSKRISNTEHGISNIEMKCQYGKLIIDPSFQYRIFRVPCWIF